MSNRLTIVKVLPQGEELSPSPEDLERWRTIFAEKRMTLEEAVATGEIECTVLPQKDENENYITVVKIGDDNYNPTPEDLESWREVFEDAAKDPDFMIFTHPAVEIKVISVGDIVSVE